MRAIDSSFARTIADGLGVTGSTLCALHCIAVPALMLLGTTIPASLSNDEFFHVALLWVLLPTAIFAFGLGCWQHRDILVLALGLIGLLGISLAAIVLHDLLGESGERVVTLLSAGFLVAAHYRNFKLCRAESCDHERC
ncbi:MAG: hypothetical protein CMQ49_04660 [Gammaproteobacteria bacterium]|nr:hypothetical protein [Gammaproteobacteria bacterium]